jgi:choline dehydrogenase-like flavoprotein
VALQDYGLAAGHYRPPAWHLMGTCRMGADPERSVVDAQHRAWDVPNLVVVDASVLATGGVVNPTSTVAALSLRAAELLRDRRREVRAAA